MSQKRVKMHAHARAPPTVCVVSNPQPIFGFNTKKLLPTPPITRLPLAEKRNPTVAIRTQIHHTWPINAIHPSEQALAVGGVALGARPLQRRGRARRPVADANVGHKR